MPKVSITSVNYNSEKFIRSCLNSVAAQIFKDFEMIIVDNASSDNSADIIEKEFPFVHLFRNRQNIGYCKAQNSAISLSKGDYIAALNLDIILDQNFLAEMAKAIEANTFIGSVAPKLLKLKDGVKTDIIDSLGHAIGKNRCAKNIGEGQKDSKKYDKSNFVFGVSGAAPLYRKKMLEEIRFEDEYLDKDFISGYDDVDIDWRSKLLGWETVYCPNAIGWHIRGGSTKKYSFKWRYFNYRNRHLMMIKNDSLINILFDLPYLIIYELGIFLSMLIQFQLIPVIIGVLIMVPKFLLKRKALQNRRKATNLEIRKYFVT